jgi:outer membrane protein OmpA-like peptidoglycan-associated protein
MIIYKSIVILCLVFVGFFLTSVKSDEKNLVANSENKIAIKHINESLTFIEKANQEKSSGNLLKSAQYIKISEIKLKTAESLLRSYLINAKTAELETNLVSIRSENRKLKEQFKDNVSRLKQFKDKITLSNELIYNNSLNNLESALSQINDAEQVDATIYSSNLLNQAYTHYQKASEYHKKGDYEQSVIDSEQSLEFAKQAFEQSLDKYRAKENLTNHLTNIFGFTTDNINSAITLSSKEIFSPQSSTIRFDIYPSLDKIAGIIKNYEDLKIEVKAYNDSFKSSKKNMDLSNTQKEIIKGYFISKGINERSFIEKKYTTKEITNQRKIEIILDI